MNATQTYLRGGWVVEFHKNIHMYSHALKLSRKSETYDVPCESTPSGIVAIWPYELKVSDAAFQELLAVLREWASQSGLRYRLYTSPRDYEANDPTI
jgi:hypothetical protein